MAIIACCRPRPRRGEASDAEVAEPALSFLFALLAALDSPAFFFLTAFASAPLRPSSLAKPVPRDSIVSSAFSRTNGSYDHQLIISCIGIGVHVILRALLAISLAMPSVISISGIKRPSKSIASITRIFHSSISCMTLSRSLSGVFHFRASLRAALVASM